MVTRRSLLTAAPAAAAGALALSSCGGSGGGGSKGGDGLQTLSWMTMLHTPTTPDASGPVHKGIEKNTGQKFSVQWVPDASKEEKINSVLASGDVADLTSLTQLSQSPVRKALNSGMFWEVEPFLKEFDNLKDIDPTILDGARVDGKLYGVPFQKILARYGVLIRQDWLDELGLEVPHTIDELSEVALAFATEDPSGKGKGKTTGFIDRMESFGVAFRSLAGYFGAGETFQEESGKIVPACATDPWKEAMTWYRNLFEQGAVNKEFITMQKSNQQDAIAQGKGGIVVTGLFEAPNYVALAKKIDPDTKVDWTLINDITYKDVPRRVVSDTGGGVGGLLAISSASVKSEDEVRSILKFVDALIDEENFDLMTNGIEGTHYETKDGGAVEITDRTLWEQEVQPYSGSRPSETAKIYKSTDPYVNTANKLMDENADYAVTNPVQSLSSEAFDSSWATIQQNIQDAYNQFMSGQIDMAGYEKVLDAQNGQGLDKILEEFTAGYEKLDH
jgi:putative aldouronate transport system substrate-binding protein